MELSTEAKVVAGTFWGRMYLTTLSFDRPWALTTQTRKGLDELVEAGFLTMTPRNNIKDCPLDWEPTDKMKSERPGKNVSYDFICKNSFSMTTD